MCKACGEAERLEKIGLERKERVDKTEDIDILLQSQILRFNARHLKDYHCTCDKEGE